MNQFYECKYHLRRSAPCLHAFKVFIGFREDYFSIQSKVYDNRKEDVRVFEH